MNAAICSSFAALLLAISATASSAASLIANAGFETGSLAPWYATSGAPTVSSAEAHSGIYSAAALGFEEIRQDFAATDTALITQVSFWIKRPPFPFSQYTFHYSDAADGVFFASASTSDWEFFDVTVNLLSGVHLNGFSIFGTSSGPAYLDDFTIATAAVATPLPAAMPMFAAGLAGLGLLARRRRRRQRD